MEFHGVGLLEFKLFCGGGTGRLVGKVGDFFPTFFPPNRSDWKLGCLVSIYKEDAR